MVFMIIVYQSANVMARQLKLAIHIPISFPDALIACFPWCFTKLSCLLNPLASLAYLLPDYFLYLPPKYLEFYFFHFFSVLSTV